MEDSIKTRGEIRFQKCGRFGDYNVEGFRYCNGLEEIGWHMTALPGIGDLHSYWVWKGKFRGLRIGTATEHSNSVDIEILGPLEVAPEEKKAVLEAITEWTEEGKNPSLSNLSPRTLP